MPIHQAVIVSCNETGCTASTIAGLQLTGPCGVSRLIHLEGGWLVNENDAWCKDHCKGKVPTEKEA